MLQKLKTLVALSLVLLLTLPGIMISGAEREINSESTIPVIPKTRNILAQATLALKGRNFIWAVIPTSSMEDTIMTGDTICADKTAYDSTDPERFDVVIFYYPDDESTLFVKRIIGLPGETVEIKNGAVYINDDPEPLEEIYLKEPLEKSSSGPYEVPEGHYFLLGDNRDNSADSRYWNHKFVAKEKIIAKVVSILR